jgi:hypothetical protein
VIGARVLFAGDALPRAVSRVAHGRVVEPARANLGGGAVNDLVEVMAVHN